MSATMSTASLSVGSNLGSMPRVSPISSDTARTSVRSSPATLRTPTVPDRSSAQVRPHDIVDVDRIHARTPLAVELNGLSERIRSTSRGRILRSGRGHTARTAAGSQCPDGRRRLERTVARRSWWPRSPAPPGRTVERTCSLTVNGAGRCTAPRARSSRARVDPVPLRH